MLRRALRLTQEEFAARYQIPLGTLRDWEQQRAEPDRPARPPHTSTLLPATPRACNVRSSAQWRARQVWKRRRVGDTGTVNALALGIAIKLPVPQLC
jgi:hypothetical protein